MRLLFILIFVILLVPCKSFALGLGEIRIYSNLNEPLHAEIPLIDYEGIDYNSIKVKLARAGDFERLGLLRDPILALLKLKVLINKDERMVVAIDSSNSVQAPYLELLIDLSWPNGKLSRAFTVLLDPPEKNSAAHPFTYSPVAKKPEYSNFVVNNTSNTSDPFITSSSWSYKPSRLPSIPVLSSQNINIMSSQQAHASSKDAELRILEQRLKALEKHTGDLTTTLNIRDKEHAGLRKTIVDLNHQLTELKANVSSKQNELVPIIWMNYALVLCIFILSFLYLTKKYTNKSEKPKVIDNADADNSNNKHIEREDIEDIIESSVSAEDSQEFKLEQADNEKFILPTSKARWKKALEEKVPYLIQDHDEQIVVASSVSPSLLSSSQVQTLPHKPGAHIKSSQALKALLQLARNYYSQGDMLAARKALEEIKQYGNAAQIDEAELLIAQIDAHKNE